MNIPLMPKATAVWLVDNTKLSFEQIAIFCNLHELEVQGIADGDVAQGMQGYNPIDNNQLTREEITRCENDKKAKLEIIKSEILVIGHLISKEGSFQFILIEFFSLYFLFAKICNKDFA